MRKTALGSLCTVLSVIGCARDHEASVPFWQPSSDLDAGQVHVVDSGAWLPDAPTDSSFADAQPPAPDAGSMPAAPDPQWSVFDPNEVYLYGTLEEGACYRDAITHWSTAYFGLVGFACGSGDVAIRPDGRLVYYDGDSRSARIFVADARVQDANEAYPDAPGENDELLPAPACGGAGSFVFGPTADEYLYTCAADSAWYGPSDQLAYDGTEDVRAYGAQATLLLESSLYRLDTSETLPIVGMSAYDVGPVAVRAVADGFWLVMENADRNAADLWHVALDGTASQIGSYAEVDEGFSLESGTCALDASGRLFQIGNWTSEPEYDLILRRTLDGVMEVVYHESDMPVVRAHISYLVTGARQTHL